MNNNVTSGNVWSKQDVRRSSVLSHQFSGDPKTAPSSEAWKRGEIRKECGESGSEGSSGLRLPTPHPHDQAGAHEVPPCSSGGQP